MEHITLLLREQMKKMCSKISTHTHTPYRIPIVCLFGFGDGRVFIWQCCIYVRTACSILMGLAFHRCVTSRPYFYLIIVFLILTSGRFVCCHFHGQFCRRLLSVSVFAVAVVVVVIIAGTTSYSGTDDDDHFHWKFIPLIINQEYKRVTITRNTQCINNLFLGDHWNAFFFFFFFFFV